jgi:hypothetical protein
MASVSRAGIRCRRADAASNAQLSCPNRTHTQNHFTYHTRSRGAILSHEKSARLEKIPQTTAGDRHGEHAVIESFAARLAALTAFMQPNKSAFSSASELQLFLSFNLGDADARRRAEAAFC